MEEGRILVGPGAVGFVLLSSLPFFPPLLLLCLPIAETERQWLPWKAVTGRAVPVLLTNHRFGSVLAENPSDSMKANEVHT